MKQKPLFQRTLSSEIRIVRREVSGWEWNLSHLFAELSLPVPRDLLVVGAVYVVSRGIWRGPWDTSGNFSYPAPEPRTSVHLNKPHRSHCPSRTPRAYVLQWLKAVQEIQTICTYSLEKFHGFFLARVGSTFGLNLVGQPT